MIPVPIAAFPPAGRRSRRRGLPRTLAAGYGSAPFRAALEHAVTDIFREVDEDLRNDNLVRLWKRYGNYLIGLAGVYPHADYVTVNISSPNTKNLRALQSDEALDALLGAVQQRKAELQREHGRKVPVFVKIAPDLDEDQVRLIAATLKKNGIDGVIATNTTIARDAVKHLMHGGEAGGLSGAPVFEASNRVIRALRAELGRKGENELLVHCRSWADRIAANAPLAIRAMKRLYRHRLTQDFESHSHHVLMQLLQLFRSRDFQEGITSFMERRPPRFQGR